MDLGFGGLWQCLLAPLLKCIPNGQFPKSRITHNWYTDDAAPVKGQSVGRGGGERERLEEAGCQAAGGVLHESLGEIRGAFRPAQTEGANPHASVSSSVKGGE